MSAATIDGRHTMLRRAAACLLLAFSLCAALVQPAQAQTPVQGQAQSPRTSPRAAAAALRSAGLRELPGGDLTKAGHSFEASYRLSPDAEGLFLFFSLATAEGRMQAARDLARRYLAETEPASPTEAGSQLTFEHRAEAQRILELPAEPAGELAIFGPAGALVLLDDRLVGRLPLWRPLWVAGGAHQVAVELPGDRQILATEVVVLADHMLELRVQAETGTLLKSPVPSLLVRARRGAPRPELRVRLYEASARAARREHVLTLPIKSAAGLAPLPESALDSRAALDALARQHDADYVLDVSVEQKTAAERPAEAPRFGLRLFSGLTGQVVVVRALECEDCSLEQALERLEPAIAELLKLARTQPRGELVLKSQPAGAEVWSDGECIGTTPYRRASFSGMRRLELRKPGFLSWSGEALIEGNKQTLLSIELPLKPLPAVPVLAIPAVAAVPPKPKAERWPRARWRLITGALAAAGGIVLVGFGASALTVDGQCSPDTPATASYCRSHYESTPLGGALVGIGGSLGLFGGALLIVPGPLKKKLPRLQ